MLPVQDNRVISTHWGTYNVSVNQGRVSGIRSWSGDPAPAPVWEGLNGSHTGPRVAAPAIRQSFLEKQHHAGGAGRGREPFVEVDWKTALDVAAAQLDRVRATHGNAAIFGGSYGWASAGRFNHAQSQIHRFLNLLGGYTRSINSYSYGAGEVIIPRVVGSMHSLAGRHTSFKSMIGHTRLLVTFGGLPHKNAQVNAGGVTRHRYRDMLGQLAQAGVRLVSISPIRDDTSVPCEWVPLRPQTDVALMLGLAHVLASENLADLAFLARYTVGYERFRDYLLGLTDGIAKTPQWASSICQVPAQDIVQLARDMARQRTMLTMSWSVQRAENGEQPYWMTVTLASMLGQIGLEGGGFGFGYAAVNGIGLDAITLKIPALPQGRNPVSSFIPVARIADMLLNQGQSFRYDGQTLTYPDTRLIYWAGGNPFHHHQDLNRLRKAWAVPETIIVNEPWWTATAKHADIVFPTTVPYERNDIVGTSSDPFIIASAAHAKPYADARNDYEVFSELAARLGCLEEFTGGKTEEDWLRSFYAQIKEQGDEQGLKLPAFDEFWAKGMVEVPTRESAAVFSEFIHDPVGKPLRTPSGRIELFSQTIRDFGIEGQPGHPVWIEPQEWLGAAQAQAFPLHLLSNQPSSKLHSQYDHAPHSRKLKISEREPVRIHPVDAARRGIETGMIVRLFNTRGSCLAGAVVSDAVMPGVLQMATGAWLDLALDDGDGIPLDKHGNANVLTRDFGTSEIAQGSTANSCLVEIERFAGVPPPTTCFDPPAFVPRHKESIDMATTALPACPIQPLHEYLRMHARERPDAAALVWYGTVLSWLDLDRASDAFAARLQALGVKKGDPVVLFLGNCPQYVVAHYGIQKIGAIVCPNGPLNKEHELAYQVNDLKARVIVAASTLLPVVQKVKPVSTLAHVFVVHYADLLPAQPALDLPAELSTAHAEARMVPTDCEDFLAVMSGSARPAPVELDMDDLALMLYTSGTTGLPKGAMLTYGNALYKTRTSAFAMGVGRDDTQLCGAPMYHVAGMLTGVNVPVLSGDTAVLLHRFEPRATLQAIDRYRITAWYSIAPMHAACMQQPDITRFDLSSLSKNTVTSFGIAFTEALALQWKSFAPNAHAREAAYGLSETHSCDTYMPADAIRWGTVGLAVPGVVIRILDPDTGEAMATGEQGEIVLTSPGVFKGYFNKPEATVATLRDGWVHTGDMGRMDTDGYLTFMGRFKEMIKVSGYPVFPEEVETILIKHPAIAQAAVVAQPDADKGEVVKAFVVKKAGTELAADELIAWCRENMAPYKAPRQVRFLDALPTAGAGKVLRRCLKDVE